MRGITVHCQLIRKYDKISQKERGKAASGRIMRDYFLHTERIGFSRWTEKDIGLARRLWGDRQVTGYISGPGGFSDQEITERLQKERHNQKTFGVQYWPIFYLATEDFIGCCGLRPYEPEDGVYEIGFHLCPDQWGKGLGTEAAKAVMDYAFDQLHAKDLFAGHHPQNTGSRKMLEKLGFHHSHDEYYAPTGLYHPSYRLKADRQLMK